MLIKPNLKCEKSLQWCWNRYKILEISLELSISLRKTGNSPEILKSPRQSGNPSGNLEIFPEIKKSIRKPRNLSGNMEISLEIWKSLEISLEILKSFAKLEISYACATGGGPLGYTRGLANFHVCALTQYNAICSMFLGFCTSLIILFLLCALKIAFFLIHQNLPIISTHF